MTKILEQKKALFEQFSEYITQARKEKILTKALDRTRYITIALEDIFQPHNMSAALRSAECFGIQDIHVIQKRHSSKIYENVAKGAQEWLTIHNYKDPEQATKICFENLKSQGYKIIATTPHKHDMLIQDLPLDTKTALIFGTEQEGLSKYALEHADGFVKIPMYGFTESFNISVSVAICLYELSKRLRESSYNWRLNQEEIINLQLEWLGRTTDRTEQILQAIKQL